MRIFKKMVDRVSSVGDVIASVFLVIIMLLMVSEITGRYVFNKPIPGSFEVVEVCVAVVASIGFASALAQKKHLAVTILTSRLPAKAQPTLSLSAYFLGFIVTGIMVWKLALAVYDSVKVAEITTGLVPVPLYPSKIIFLFAVFLFCLQFLIHSVDSIRSRKVQGLFQENKQS